MRQKCNWICILTCFFATISGTDTAAIAYEIPEKGILVKDTPTTTVAYLGFGDGNYFVSFVTKKSKNTADGVPHPSMFIANCNKYSFQGIGSFERVPLGYVSELVRGFCNTVKERDAQYSL